MVWVLGIGIFLFLLFVFPRVMVGLIALCGVAIGGFFLWTKIGDNERARLRAAVTVTVTYDLERCNPEYPLFVQIFNGSEDTVEKVWFRIEGRRAGYSDPLYDSGYFGYSSDKIVPSGKGWANCWTLPRQAYGVSGQTIALYPPKTLVWVVNSSNPIFLNR